MMMIMFNHVEQNPKMKKENFWLLSIKNDLMIFFSRKQNKTKKFLPTKEFRKILFFNSTKERKAGFSYNAGVTILCKSNERERDKTKHIHFVKKKHTWLFCC